MRKVVVNEWMTLDGVVQGPGYADEDTTAVSRTAAGICATSTISLDLGGRRSRPAGGFLFGRRTYESFASYWPPLPKRSGDLRASEHVAEVRGVDDAYRSARVAARALLHGDVAAAVRFPEAG